MRRRRECITCGERYTTFETAELVMPRIIKRDGSREPFNEVKLRSGLQRAVEKRPVSVDAVETILSRTMHALRSTGERELEAHRIGEIVMEHLRGLDEVAYVRFASVYRRFQDLSEFQEEITRLETARRSDNGQLELPVED